MTNTEITWTRKNNGRDAMASDWRCDYHVTQIDTMDYTYWQLLVTLKDGTPVWDEYCLSQEDAMAKAGGAK